MNPSKLGLLIAFILLTACGKQVSSNLTSSNTADRPTPSKSMEPVQVPLPSSQDSLEPKAPIPIMTTTTTSTTTTSTTLKSPAKSAPSTPQEIAAAGDAPNADPVIIDSCFSPEEPCDKRIIQFLNSAKRSMEIAVFSFTHAGIAKAVIKAQERGVNVRMVVDRDQSRGKTSQVDLMMKSGIPLRFGNQEGSMHHKFTIVDRKLLQTGSYNYSYAATSYNAENQIYLKDPELVLKYQGSFENLWAQGEEK